MTTEITNSDDIIDMRDVTDRFELLEKEMQFSVQDIDSGEVTSGVTGDDMTDVSDEFAILTALLDELRGNGGDHDWRGAWYPGSLIRDSYFVDAMQELVTDTGDLPRNIPSYLAIDWEKTAENLQVDYSSVEFEGVTYWYR